MVLCVNSSVQGLGSNTYTHSSINKRKWWRIVVVVQVAALPEVNVNIVMISPKTLIFFTGKKSIPPFRVRQGFIKVR